MYCAIVAVNPARSALTKLHLLGTAEYTDAHGVVRPSVLLLAKPYTGKPLYCGVLSAILPSLLVFVCVETLTSGLMLSSAHTMQ